MCAARQGGDETTSRPATVGPHGEGLRFVLNAAAGGGGAEDAVVEAVRTALPAAEVVRPAPGEDLDAALDRVARTTPAGSTMGVIGGDGSVNAAASHAVDRGLSLLVVPGGTLNHFARDLGLHDAHASIDALRHDDRLASDVGVIDGRVFLNTASFGAYPALVDARERLAANLGKWPAAAIAMVRVLRGQRPVHVRIDGEELRVSMIFIGNCRYEPPGLLPRRRTSLTDGHFDVRYAVAPERFGRSRLAVALMIGSLLPGSMIHRRVVTSLSITSKEGPLRLACDGETFDASGPTIAVHKHPDRLHTYGRPGRSGRGPTVRRR